MPQAVHPESKKRQERLVKLLQAGSSGGYEQVAKRLREARELFHEDVAHLVEAPLNEYLARMPGETLQQKQELVRFLNSEVRSLGIAIKHGQSEEPARLYVNTGHEPQGRFQIELLKREGGHRRTQSWVQLPKFRFTGHAERREPLAEYWADKVASHKKGRSRE